MDKVMVKRKFVDTFPNVSLNLQGKNLKKGVLVDAGAKVCIDSGDWQWLVL
jgi:hypothetical protein